MGLFSKKSRETMNSVPKLSVLAQAPDLDVLSAPPALPAAIAAANAAANPTSGQQRSASGASVGSVGSVSSLNDPKGYTLRGKLGLVKPPQNVFDGFDGGYEDDESGDIESCDPTSSSRDPTSSSRDLSESRDTESRDLSSPRDPTNLPPINTFVQHGTVKQYTPEFGGAEFASTEFADSADSPDFADSAKEFGGADSAQFADSSNFASSPEFHSSRNSPVKPVGVSESRPGSSGHVTKSPHVTSYTTPPLTQQAQFGSPQTFSTPSQHVETHPADHVNCSHGGHTHSHNASPHVTSPTTKTPPPPLTHPGYPKEHYIAKKKSSEALGQVLPGRDLYKEALNDYPYPLSPSELQSAPYPTCYYQKGCRQIGPHSHDDDHVTQQETDHVTQPEPVFATFDQSKYDEIQRESRDQKDKEKIVWGDNARDQTRDQDRAQLSSKGSDQSHDTIGGPRDLHSSHSSHSRDVHSRDTVSTSRPGESADSRFAEAESRAGNSESRETGSRAADSSHSRFAEAEPEYVPADLHRAESSIYEDNVESRDQSQSRDIPESRDPHSAYPTIDDFDFNSPGTHTPTTRLPLDSPGTPGTPQDLSRDFNNLSRDFNHLSVSQIKGMGLPLDSRSIASVEGNAGHVTNLGQSDSAEPDVNHGHVTQGQVVGGGSTSHHVMLEPSQAEILRSSYISTDSGGTGHVGNVGHVGSTGHVMDRHGVDRNALASHMTQDADVHEGHVMDGPGMDEIHIDSNGHVIDSHGHVIDPHANHMSSSRSGTMMTNLSSPSAAYYPAPIPMNLKLPPLLSKKNRRKSRSGISPFPSPRKSSFTSALDKPGNRSSFMSPWSHTADGSLLHYEGFAGDDFERPGRSVHRQSLGSRGSSPLKRLYLSGDEDGGGGRDGSRVRDGSRDVTRLSRDFDEVYGEYNDSAGDFDESAIDFDSRDPDFDPSHDPYYNPEKRGRRRTMSLTSINVNMDNSEIREELDEEAVEGDVTDMQRYEASANAFTRVHIDANAIVAPSAAAGFGNGISPAIDQKPGTLVEELELRKKDKRAVRGHLNKTMHQYAADGTETPLIQQIHDSQSAYGIDDRRQSLVSDKRMSMMSMMTKDHSYEDPNHHRMSLLALDSLAQMDYQQSYSKPGAAQISKQYKASRDDDEPLRVRKQRLKRQSQQLLEQRQLQENIEKQRLASVELEKKRQEAKQQRRNQFGVNAAAAAAAKEGGKKGKVLIGPGGEVIRT